MLSLTHLQCRGPRCRSGQRQALVPSAGMGALLRPVWKIFSDQKATRPSTATRSPSPETGHHHHSNRVCGCGQSGIGGGFVRSLSQLGGNMTGLTTPVLFLAEQI